MPRRGKAESKKRDRPGIGHGRSGAGPPRSGGPAERCRVRKKRDSYAGALLALLSFRERAQAAEFLQGISNMLGYGRLVDPEAGGDFALGMALEIVEG